MVFRSPTHLGPLVPSPVEQVPGSPRAWSGVFTLTFFNTARGTYQDLYVTAAETDGENRMDLWPTHLYVYLSQRPMAQAEVSSWVKRHSPPVCAFMPDRHPDPNVSAANHTSFTSFSRLLRDNQMVAFAPWNAPDRLPGAGILIYPTPSSGSLLIGAIFLSGPFPNFITFSQPGAASGSQTQPSQPAFHQTGGAPSAYGAPNTLQPSTSQRHHSYGGPTEQSLAASYPSSSTAWPGAKRGGS